MDQAIKAHEATYLKEVAQNNEAAFGEELKDKDARIAELEAEQEDAEINRRAVAEYQGLAIHSFRLGGALQELVTIIDNVAIGESYTFNSFTTQRAHAALAPKSEGEDVSKKAELKDKDAKITELVTRLALTKGVVCQIHPDPHNVSAGEWCGNCEGCRLYDEDRGITSTHAALAPKLEEVG